MSQSYIIHQFEDKPLSHYAYAIVSNGQMAVIDPARNPKPYYDFAKEHNAKIVAIIETHPHADFVSSHAEMQADTGATIYVSRLLSADYPHTTYDDGDVVQIGTVQLKAFNTPGHSPDSITVVAAEGGKDIAVFSGDTLFIGDCGRPDLRENAGNLKAKPEELAGQMYHSLRNVYLPLEADVIVYPAHGAGSLCGKGLSSANHSTMGVEKISNWSLQPMEQADFVKQLIEGQPFVPKYFEYDVMLNKQGAPPFQKSVDAVQIVEGSDTIKKVSLWIDTRIEDQYKKGHLANSYNIQHGGKFETWLGSIVAPGEPFGLIAATKELATELVERSAKIGYETQIDCVVVGNMGEEKSDIFSLKKFFEEKENTTIIDIRNKSEVADKMIFEDALNIPLPELRESINQIPTGKPIVIHCAGGYRSAAGMSIVKEALPGQEVYDFGEAITSI